MKTHLQPTSQAEAPVIMRKTCACGRALGPSGECAECRRKRLGIQTKLRINRPGDKYEQEAERVAEQVMRMAEPGLQGQTDEEEGQGVLQARPLVQRRMTANDHGSEAPPIVHEVLRSPGRPLDPVTRRVMESRFGHDFSEVRVHTTAHAAKSAQAVSARAFTLGQDIVFGMGQYAPGSKRGRSLLAHELTHVVQQVNQHPGRSSTFSLIQRQPQNCTPQVTGVQPPRNAPQEVTDAHNVALNWAQGGRDAVQTAINGGTLRGPIRHALDFHFARPTGRRLRAIRNRFNRIVRRLNRGDRIYFCNTAASIDCRVTDTEAATFCPSGPEYTRLCPAFFQANARSRLMGPLILIHEAAHAAGACGHIYTNQGNYPGRAPANNAEAYAQFARTSGAITGTIPLRRRTPTVPPP